jgi:hypothetical protein
MFRKSVLIIFSIVLLISAFPVLAQEEDLTETYSDEVITFNYPDGWFECGCPDTENAMAIGNTKSAPNTDNLARDEIQILVIKSMTIWIEETLDAELEADTPEAVLTDYFNGRRVETYEFDDREAAAMTVENDEAELETLFVAVELGNGEIGMLVATTRPGDLDQFEDTVMAIAETLVASEADDNRRDDEEGEESNSSTRGQGLGGRKSNENNDKDERETDRNETAIELSESFEMEEGDFALNFPEGWEIGENDGAIIMVSDEDAWNIETLSDLGRGEVLVFVYPSVDTLQDYGMGMERNTRPSTIVSYYAAMALAMGFEQAKGMQEPVIGDGDLEASSALSTLEDEYEQYVLAIDNGDGDIITLLAYSAPGELEDYVPTFEAIASTYVVR